MKAALTLLMLALLVVPLLAGVHRLRRLTRRPGTDSKARPDPK